MPLMGEDTRPSGTKKPRNARLFNLWWAHTDSNRYVVRRFPAWILSVRFFGL